MPEFIKYAIYFFIHEQIYMLMRSYWPGENVFRVLVFATAASQRQKSESQIRLRRTQLIE